MSFRSKCIVIFEKNVRMKKKSKRGAMLMEAYTLPFTLDVEMRAYHNKAFTLGVIKANLKEDYEIWLCNKLINSIQRSNGVFDAYHEGLWSIEEGMMSVQTIKLSPSTYKQTYIDIVNLNKEMLKEGSYILGFFDEFFIKGKEAYQKYHFNHDYLILGFDDKKQVFKSVAYLSDGKYDFFDIAYNAYYNSIVNSNEKTLFVQYYQLNKDYHPKIEIDEIRKKMINYLNAQQDDVGYEFFAKSYGVQVWKEFKDYVRKCKLENLDVRFSRIYVEHKGIMLKRIKTLILLGYIENMKLIEVYEKNVYKSAQIVHGLFIKYNLTHNEEIIHKLLALIEEINKMDELVVSEVVEELQKKLYLD